MEQRESAIECMKVWLSHENELGKEPFSIEIADEFDLHDLHYYILKFKKTRLSPWLVGVCGGYTEDELGHCGHIFSEYQIFQSRTAQQHCIDMVEKMRDYWMNEAKKYEPLEKQTTFVDFVLLKNKDIDLKLVFDYLKTHCHMDYDDFDQTDETIIVTNVQDSIISLSLMDMPVPEGEAEYYAQGCYMWEDAVTHVKEHQAHLIASTLGKNISTKQAKLIQSQLIDACLQFEQAIGVYGHEMVWPKHIYHAVMNDYYQKSYLPVLLWVYLGFVTNQKGHHIYTIGLRDFGHYEIETLPSLMSLSDLHSFVFNVVCYIVEEDAVLHDGETIGMSATHKCQITLSDGIFLDQQTLKIEVTENNE